MGAKKGKGKGKGKKKKVEAPVIVIKKEEPKPEPIPEDPIPITTHLLEMEETIEAYRKEVLDEVYEETPIFHLNFKKNFISALQNLVYQLSFIKDKRLKYEETEKVYVWYREKMSAFDKLKNVDTRTSQLSHQRFPRVDHIVKDDYYEARNFPLNFEFDFRDGNMGIMPPKDHLKQFQVKHIVKQEEQNDKYDPTNTTNDFFAKDRPFTAFDREKSLQDQKLRIQSAYTNRLQSATTNNTGSQFNQTNYRPTTANTSGLGAALIEPVHKVNILHEDLHIGQNRDIKSFYSTYKPKYESNTLNLEKLDMQMKHKQLKEKRFLEETKDFLHEWGSTKSKKEEEVERKREIKKIFEVFEEKYKKEEEDARIALDRELKEKKSSRKGLIVEDQEELLEIGKEESFKDDDDEEHIVINKVKNMYVDNLLIKNEEKIGNIKIKSDTIINKSNLPNDLMTKNQDLTKLPNEMKPALSILNPIAHTRQIYSKNVNLKEIDNPKDGYAFHYHPLSILENLNNEEIHPERAFKKRPLTGINFKPVDKILDDYLDKRKEISEFRKAELIKLKDTLLNKDIHVPLTNLQNALLPPNNIKDNYPKHFLPRPGSGLQPKIFRPAEKKRGKSGKKGAGASASKSTSKPKKIKKK